MMKPTTETFLDEDIPIDKSLLQDFPINNIVSWSYLELWCATRSIEVNKEFIWFITTGAFYLDSLYDILLDTITTTDFITQYVNTVDYVELIYKLFQPTRSHKVFEYSAKQAWLEFLRNRDVEAGKQWGMGIKKRYFFADDDYVRMYKLMKALDNRFPLLIIQFYDKFKKTLHLYDLSFAEWILKRTRIKADNSPVFKKILVAMEKEFKNRQRIVSFLT